MLGLVYTVVGLGILLDTSRYTKLFDDVFKNTALLYYGGVMALLVGYLITTFGPNSVTLDYAGLVSLIGWIALVKGVLLLVKPDVIRTSAAFWMKNMQLAGGIALILGLILGYYGFAL